MADKIFNFKTEIGWSEVMAFVALFLAAFSLYIQYSANKASVSLTNDKLVSTIFIDKDGNKKFFGYMRATITNSGNKAVTLLGLKPHEYMGLVLSSTYEQNTDELEKDKLICKIFQIPDDILSEKLNEKNILSFEDQGLEKLSVMNKVINPGEVYMLNIGVIYDLFSDKTKHYKTVIFSSELIFSNGQKLLFGAADNNLPRI